MVLIILAVVVMVALVLLLLGVVTGIVLVRRHWSWLGPLSIAGLIVCVTIGMFDVLVDGSLQPPVSAEVNQGANAAASQPALRSGEIDLSAEPAEAPPAPVAVAIDPSAPAWTHRKPGELDSAKQNPDIVVYAGPKLSHTSCEVELDRQLQEAVDQYIQTEIAPQGVAPVRVPANYIRDRLVGEDIYARKARRAGTATVEPQEMVELFALVKFDADARKHLQELCRESVVQERMKTAGLGLAGILAVLSVAWAVLRRGGHATA